MHIGQSYIVYSRYLPTLDNGDEIDSGWIDMEHADKVQFSGAASASGLTMTLESRADADQATLSSSVTYTEGTFYMFNVICRQRYMRFRWANNTGAQVTDASMEIKQSFGASDKLSVFPVSVQPTDFSQAALVQSVGKGQQPDGDYVNIPADGNAFQTTTALGATALNGAISDSATTITVDSTSSFPSSGNIKIEDEIISYTGTTSTTFTGCTRGQEGTTAASHADNVAVRGIYISAWIDTDGWNSIELFLNADTASQFLGFEVEFTDDTQAATPDILAAKRYTFSELDVVNGFETIRLPTLLDGFRVKYANGTTAQSSFVLDGTLRTLAANFKFNLGGGLITADFDTEAALGLVSNYEIGTKFGRVKGTDAMDNAVDIWAFADDSVSPRADTKTFPTSASTFYLASSSSSDTSVTMTVEYIDENGFAAKTNVNLNGQTGVSLGASALDVNRMYVSGGTAAVGIVYATTANNFSLGQPVTPSECVAVAPAGYNHTQLSHFTVPRGKKMIIKGYDVYVSRASGAAGSADVTLRVKASGGVSQVIREFFPTTAVPISKQGSNIVIEPRSQVVWRLDDVSDNDTNVSCVWDYELIDV